MSTLREVQLAFRDAMARGADANFAAEIVPDGLAAGDRIAIYRNNSRIVFSNALRGQFPVVRALGGDEWFAGTAHRYREQHPSASGNLFDIGRHFPGYLAGELASSQYEYFADVARLEWVYQEASAAADSPAFDLGSLARVAPHDYGRIQFRLHPAARVVRCRYSVLEIWLAHRVNPSVPATCDLNQPQIVLTTRGAAGLALAALSTDEWLLLQAFATGMALEQAMHAVSDGHNDPGPVAALTRLAQLGALAGFSLASAP